MGGGDGGHTTRVFEIDHRMAVANRRRPGGFDLGEDASVGPVLVFNSVAREKASSCRCYTFELPEKIQLLTDYSEWASSLRTQGVTVESFVPEWRGALSIAKRLGKVIATDTLQPCVLCNGAEGHKCRFPDAHAAHGLSSIGRSLQDPIGRANGLTVLEELLGDPVTTTSLGSLLVDVSVETRDGGYAEANHPGSENGWTRPADSTPIRHAGLGSPPLLSGIVATRSASVKGWKIANPFPNQTAPRKVGASDQRNVHSTASTAPTSCIGSILKAS